MCVITIPYNQPGGGGGVLIYIEGGYVCDHNTL